MSDFGKWLFWGGLGLAAIGALFWLGGDRMRWFGHLPGDIHLEREGDSFHFPVVTCLLLSGLLTVIWRLLSR